MKYTFIDDQNESADNAPVEHSSSDDSSGDESSGDESARDDSSEDVSLAVELPGNTLRKAREKLRLEITDVAKKLHLHEELVVALESDDYQRFSAPIYVSGSIRNYARLLKLPPDPLVEAYEQLGTEDPPILSELSSKIHKRRPRKNGIEPWAGYIIVGSVSLLLLVWWLSQSPSTEDIIIEAEIIDELQLQAGVELVNTTQDIIQLSPQSNRTEKNQENIADEAPVPEPTDTLVLDFTDDSWVEISDSTGRRLYFAMGEAGESKTLHGVAPFNILLGYSPGVSMEYNGIAFDQAPYTRQDVARFRLGRK